MKQFESLLADEIIAIAASKEPPAVVALPPGIGPPGEQATSGTQPKTAKIMIVDDDPINVEVISNVLKSVGYDQLVELVNSTRVIEAIGEEQPDLLLLDILMPHANGLEILEAVRRSERFAHLPVIMMTGLDSRNTKLKALDRGATDFVLKPPEPMDLVPRVRNALSLKAYRDRLEGRTRELENLIAALKVELAASRVETTRCLARMAELRDDDSGRHVIRVGQYAGIIARGLGVEEDLVALLEQAAQLHDVGKVALSDSILLKAGQLDSSERQAMEKHCTDGKRILSPEIEDAVKVQSCHALLGATLLEVGGSSILKLAARIALTHHERWDGTGYPLGLSGDDIPIEGRITAVADVFDALSNKRPHKPAFVLEKCFAMLEVERGKHFDPMVLDAFFAAREQIIRVKMECPDTD